MSFPVDACKQFAGNSLNQEAIDCRVTRHKTALEGRINALCLEIGFRQASGQNIDTLSDEFEKKITTIEKDPNEQNKLRTYGNHVIALGQLYYHAQHLT